MSGMGQSINISNNLIVTTFQRTLLHQFLIVLGLLIALSVAWNLLRAVQLRRAIALAAAGTAVATSSDGAPEPSARRILRIAFGVIWIFDGLLQAQSAMPVGLPSQVIQPLTTTAPDWVRHLVNAGILIWNNHPIQAAVASVWIQVGIGVWLLIAPRGRWSQAGALASVGWGLAVWAFGEAFGGIFSPGLSWCFGAPGAVLLYAFAGGLIALPEQVWSNPRTGRSILSVMGVFFLGMSVLQAWPGRGFWQGNLGHGQVGAIASMAQTMATTSQPAVLASWVSAFGGFDAAHGFAVNLVIVVALAGVGVGFCSGRIHLVRAAVLLGVVVCLADWVLIQDFAFFGGLGTDPNSMIPMCLIFVAGYIACDRVPEAARTVEPAASMSLWASRLRADVTYAFKTIAAACAVAITLLGALPMLFASLNPTADAIVTEAINGAPGLTDTVTPNFTLTDQYGKNVALSSLRNRVLTLAFLDPVCTNDCPLIGQELAAADRNLSADTNKTIFVAVVTNPIYRSIADMRAFDEQEGLDTLPNWLFLTGSPSALAHVWYEFGVQAALSPAGSMVNHSDIAYVIDGRGRTREILSSNPGSGTASTKSSFTGLLDQEIVSLLPTTA